MADETNMNPLKPKGHFIENRTTEMILGLVLFVVGAFLLYDAFDGRGKKLPWLANAITPW